jgi:type VI secretion system secreted protein Hcp
VATGDMLLVAEGVTGESNDTIHPGAIEVTSWSWGLQATTDVSTGLPSGRRKLAELQIVKLVDQSSPILMTFLKNNVTLKTVDLFVRKAGSEALEYFTIKLTKARVTSVQIDSDKTELVERVSFAFVSVEVIYKPQSSTGARGGGDRIFNDTAYDQH